MKPNFSLRHLMAIVASSLTAISLAPAQTTVNWDGDTSNLWATAGNWDTLPTSSLTANIANFDGGWINAPTIGAGTSIAGITIGGSNGTMTLTTGGFLTIGGSGISIANGAGAFTISGTTILGAAQSWTNNSSNLFTFGAVTNGANTLTIGGTGNTIASGVISNGAGGLTKEGTGILTLNAANLYTGATTVNGGELRWGIANAIAGGALNINNGGTVNMQTFADTVGTITIAKGGSITGTTGILTTGSGGLVSNDGGTISGFSAGAGLRLGGGITYNSTGPGSTTLQIDHIFIPDLSPTFNIADGDAEIDFEITGTLSGGGNNISRNITKTGAGVMQFSGSAANTTSTNQMPLAIWDGTVIFNKSAEVNAIPNSAITIGDGIGAAGSAILQYRTSNNQIQDSSITINSDGLFDLNGRSETTAGALTVNGGSITTGAGTLSLGNATNTISGASTVTGNLTFTGTAATNLTLGGTTSINGTTTFSGGNGGGITATGTTSIAGTLAFGSNSRTIAVTNAGDILKITANTTGSGTITKNGAGTLQIGDGTTAGSMSSTSALTMGGGTLAILAPTTGSSSQTVASLATTASTNSIIRLTPSTTGNTTLTITSGTLSTGAGSSLNFDYSAGTTVGGTVGNNYVIWNPTLTAGIIGGAYSVTDSGGIGFATVSGGNVVRLTDPGGAGLPVSTGSATGSYFIGSGYSIDSTSTPGSLVQALSGAVAASNVTVDTTGLASGANLALGTNILTLGAGMAFNGANPYQITASGAGGIRAATSGGTIYLNNGNSSTVSIDAPILANGAGGLTVNGTGTTILGGVNTYTGTTFLNGGTLGVANQLALQNSTLTMGGGSAELVFDSSVAGNAFTFGGLAASGSGTGYNIALQNNAVIPADISLTVGGNNATTTFAGNLIGGGTLTKVGTGTLTLTGTNTYSGGTILNGGALSVNSDAALGVAGTSISVIGNTTLNSLATVSTEYNRAISLGAGTTLTLTHAGANTASFSGAITGSGNLTATVGASGSTIALTNAGNTFTGDLLANVATSNTLRLSFNSIGDGGMLSLGKTSHSVYIQYTGSSDLVLNNRRIDLNSSFGNTNDGGGNPISMFENNGTGAIRFNANMTVAAGKTGTFFFGGTNTGDNTYAGVITNSSGGTLSIGKHGAGKWTLSNDNTFAGGVEVRGGTLVLSGTNTYTGATTISGGTLVVSTLANYGDNSSIGKGTSGTSISMGSASSLVYTGGDQTTDRSITFTAASAGAGNSVNVVNNGTGALNFTATEFNTGTGNNTNNRYLTLGGTNGGTISGAIRNTGTSNQGYIQVIKNGTGTWTMAGANTYFGDTTLNAGTLRLDYDASDTSKLSDWVATDANSINDFNGGTLELYGGSHTEVMGNLVLNGGTTFIKRTDAPSAPAATSKLQMGTITFSGGAIDFSADSIATTTSGVTNGILNVRATVAGTNFAMKSGSNIVAYDYVTSGSTGYTGGAMAANTNYAMQTAGGANALSGNTGATTNTLKIANTATGSLAVGTNTFTIGAILFAGSADYDLTTTGTGRITPSVLHNYGTGGAVLNLGALGGALNQYGTGTTVLTAAAQNAAGVNVYGGTVQISNNNQIGLPSNGNGVTLNNGTLLSNGSVTLNNSGSNSRNVTLGAGGGTLAATTGNSLTVTGVISGTASQLPTLTIGSATNDGTVTLSGANTYNGRTFISGGTLSVGTIGNGGVAGNLGQASSLAYNIVFDGGTLLYTGADATSDRAFTISANKTATIDTTNNLSLAGATGPATNGALTKTGAGILTLTGANTYTGTTTISAGTLALGNATNTLANTSAVNVNGGTLSLGANSDTVGAVTLTSGSITSSTGVLTGSSYDVRSGSVSAILGGSGALTKSTSGTVTLTGANTYTGLTTVTAGTLRVHGSTAAASNFIVENGGTLGGSGTIGGNVTLNSGATLAPGASIESLATGSNTWNGGSRVQFEFSTDGSTGTAGAQWDLLTITGTLDLTGASSGNPITFDLVSMLDATTSGPLASWDPDANTTWSGIVTTTGGITGFASNLFAFNTTGFTNTLNGTFNISQNGNNLDLNYVTNYVIPEPKAALLGAIGILLLLRRRR